MKKIIFILLFMVFVSNAQTKNKFDLYRIQKGDTYMSIAKRFGMSVKEFKALNAYDDSTKLLVGVSVFVKPVKKPEYHLVKKKETLYSISKMHHLSVEKLKQLNGLKGNDIRVGQYLKIK